MLTSRHPLLEDTPDFVHNYYERLVLQEAFSQSDRIQQGDREFLADVACVALNRLPPRYIRHDVDMTFFMSPQDMMEIERKVRDAVSDALNYVERRERGEDPTLAPVEASLSGNRASKSTPTKTISGEKETSDTAIDRQKSNDTHTPKDTHISQETEKNTKKQTKTKSSKKKP